MFKNLIWVGDIRRRVASFPKSVRQDIGTALFSVQMGEKPLDAKLLKGFGSGVLEIVTRGNGDTFRTVYAVQIDEAVYVLHAFQKKSPRGIKTAQKDITLIHHRLKMAVSIAKGDLS